MHDILLHKLAESQSRKKETNKMSNSPIEDFNWEVAERKGIKGGYTKADRDALEKMYDATLFTSKQNEVALGTVVGITDKDVVVNLGLKSDGLVALSEFRDLPDL